MIDDDAVEWVPLFACHKIALLNDRPHISGPVGEMFELLCTKDVTLV